MADKKEGEKETTPEEYFEGKWDSVELLKDQMVEFKGYPKPGNRFHVIMEAPNTSIEPIYFWCLTHFRGLGYPVVDKLTDLFSATESSSLFGATNQRLGLTQDRVMGFLRVINDMVKGIPPYIREVRAIDEVMRHYVDSEKFGEVGQASETTLKGRFVDLVEGGTKSPASVFGLANTVGFAALPDLFFQFRVNKDDVEIDPKTGKVKNWYTERVAEKIAKMSTTHPAGKGEFNPQLIGVLQRKLKQYYSWKQSSKMELETRHRYLAKYLRQYVSTIKLYMNWAKPYLKQIKRLGLDINQSSNAELVRAFESSLIEIEVLARKAEPKTKQGKGPYNCILLTFKYRTKPSMSFTTQDYQHRGPVHVGEADMTWRSYSWDEKDIEMFKKAQAEEEFDLLKSIDKTLELALEDVSEEFSDWLKNVDIHTEDQKKRDKDKAEEERLAKIEAEKPNFIAAMFTPITDGVKSTGEVFGAVAKGTTDVFKMFKSKSSDKDTDKYELTDAKKAVLKSAKVMCYLHYKNFKKSHGMVAW
jgi:hypothetical protein